jgi:hypothetical protein
VADKILDGTDVAGKFLGERPRVTCQTRYTLPEGVVEALEVMGCAGVLRNRVVPLRRDYPLIHLILDFGQSSC